MVHTRKNVTKLHDKELSQVVRQKKNKKIVRQKTATKIKAWSSFGYHGNCRDTLVAMITMVAIQIFWLP